MHGYEGPGPVHGYEDPEPVHGYEDPESVHGYEDPEPVHGYEDPESVRRCRESGAGARITPGSRSLSTNDEGPRPERGWRGSRSLCGGAGTLVLSAGSGDSYSDGAQ